MSKFPNANEPAFPNEIIDPNFGAKLEGGLTKREYFAGLFAAQMCVGEDIKEVVAMNAVKFADALLKQLES